MKQHQTHDPKARQGAAPTDYNAALLSITQEWFELKKKTSFQGQKQTTTLKAYNLFNRCIKTLSRQMMTS